MRSDCPGELEGICVKLIQKDPKYRYSTAVLVAEALDAWRVKYRNSALVRTGAGTSSLQLGEEGDRKSADGSGLQQDTVSNRGGDTVTGRSASSIVNLSASDSGVLVRLANRSAADSSSKIDLEAEIARRSRTFGLSSTHGSSNSIPNAQLSGVSPSTMPPIPGRGPSKVLWVVGLLIMFVMAVILGIAIAKLTEFKSTSNGANASLIPDIEYSASASFALPHSV